MQGRGATGPGAACHDKHHAISRPRPALVDANRNARTPLQRIAATDGQKHRLGCLRDPQAILAAVAGLAVSVALLRRL